MAGTTKFGPESIKALAFDVGGTVFNWYHTVCDAVDALAGERDADVDAGAFANAWRLGMFAVLSEVRFGARGAMSTDAMQRAGPHRGGHGRPGGRLVPAQALARRAGRGRPAA